MKPTAKRFDLVPRERSALDVAGAADRLGMSKAEFLAWVHEALLEPTYSVDETAQHLGCTRWQVHELIALGTKHGERLHPRRGGLYPTFKTSHRNRRVPLTAIERHKQHMERVHDAA